MEESAAGSAGDEQTSRAAGPPLLGRRRDGARSRRRTFSATARRETLSLAVCGVGPSRSLELCASSRPTTTTSRDTSRGDHMTQLQCSTSLPGGGFLRSAGLHPLGVVNPPPLRPHQCLGIVSNSQRRERRGEQKRPVSWVRARTHEDQSRREADPGGTRERNRHSFSGAFCNSQSDPVRGPSRQLVLPRNAGLVPTASMSAEPTKREGQALSGQSRASLPLVQQTTARDGGQEIRIEVRSSRESNHRESAQPTEKTVSALSASLPRLPPPATPTADMESKPPHRGRAETIPGSERVHRISIVSVGAAESQRTHCQRRRHWQQSPDRREGRLSQGWSQTQPLGGLTGLPVYQDSRQVRTWRRRDAEKAGVGRGGEAEVSKDRIVIDVQEYLANVQQ